MIRSLGPFWNNLVKLLGSMLSGGQARTEPWEWPGYSNGPTKSRYSPCPDFSTIQAEGNEGPRLFHSTETCGSTTGGVFRVRDVAFPSLQGSSRALCYQLGSFPLMGLVFFFFFPMPNENIGPEINKSLSRRHKGTSGELVMFCFQNWVLITWMCSVCEIH